MSNNIQRGLLAIGAFATVGVAQAAVSTTEVITAMTDAGTAIAAVGAAYLIVKVGIKVWPWVASALGR